MVPKNVTHLNELEDEVESINLTTIAVPTIRTLCDWTSECNRNNHSNMSTGDNNEDTSLMKFFDEVPVLLKSNGWVFSLLTICIIGVISCVCVFAFIFARVCKKDILEGNPCSTFLLIVATIVAYMSVLPFTVETELGDRTLCALKLFGTSISYCAIFSIILSRIVMILTCDYNGSFMSHINGYLQGFLCFFMFAVQLGVVFEFWILGWILSDVDYCGKFVNTNLFLSYSAYNSFLLLLIAFTAPFVTKSRRNYKEGVCFTLLSFCFVIVWTMWTFGYFVSPVSWRDFCVASGLTATASAVVVCVLIPRTYLITTGLVRDRITSAIPSNMSNFVDMNYRSTQALYDCVNSDAAAAKNGELNGTFYDEPHSSSSISRVDAQSCRRLADVLVHDVVENDYESCCNVLEAVEQKITKF